MTSHRFTEKGCMPSEEELLPALGIEANEAWVHLREFAKQNYDHEAEWNYGGKNYGWNIRYRKSGKTLFSMFPEKNNGFTCLLVLGKQELAKYQDKREEFTEAFQAEVDSAAQYHDGRWLWLTITGVQQLEDIERLIRIKKKTKALL